jgi:hypothetical protein
VLVAHVGGRWYADFNGLYGSAHVLGCSRAVRPRVLMRTQCARASAMDDNGIRATVVQHCISSTEIINRMRKLQFGAGSEEEMVHQMLAGGECSLGVALAVFSIIGCETATTSH